MESCEIAQQRRNKNLMVHYNACFKLGLKKTWSPSRHLRDRAALSAVIIQVRGAYTFKGALVCVALRAPPVIRELIKRCHLNIVVMLMTTDRTEVDHPPLL
jgi:hypothetical protein